MPTAGGGTEGGGAAVGGGAGGGADGGNEGGGVVLPGMVSTWPAYMIFGLLIPLAWASVATVTPWVTAILKRVSPR